MKLYVDMLSLIQIAQFSIDSAKFLALWELRNARNLSASGSGQRVMYIAITKLYSWFLKYPCKIKPKTSLTCPKFFFHRRTHIKLIHNQTKSKNPSPAQNSKILPSLSQENKHTHHSPIHIYHKLSVTNPPIPKEKNDLPSTHPNQSIPTTSHEERRISYNNICSATGVSRDNACRNDDKCNGKRSREWYRKCSSTYCTGWFRGLVLLPLWNRDSPWLVTSCRLVPSVAL